MMIISQSIMHYCLYPTDSLIVSLVNTVQPSNRLNGIVNVTVGGVSGMACSKTWDDRAANVTCRQLGFLGGIAYVFNNPRNGYPFVTGYVNCTGLETSLTECNYSRLGQDTGCTSGNYFAGALCYEVSYASAQCMLTGMQETFSIKITERIMKIGLSNVIFNM